MCLKHEEKEGEEKCRRAPILAEREREREIASHEGMKNKSSRGIVCPRFGEGDLNRKQNCDDRVRSEAKCFFLSFQLVDFLLLRLLLLFSLLFFSFLVPSPSMDSHSQIRSSHHAGPNNKEKKGDFFCKKIKAKKRQPKVKRCSIAPN